MSPGAARPGPTASPGATTDEDTKVTKLQRLYDEQGQSPWLDNLTRPYLRDGTLARLIRAGVRGVTANPTIFARAIEGSDAYDDQFAALTAKGCSTPDAYWDLVVDDIIEALAVLRPTFDASGGTDGFVSIEVAPELARDTDATIAAARDLHQRIARPNLFVKIPATPEGIPAIRAMIGEGRPLWASTSTKDPALPDTLYVDGLIGPDTVNTLPEATITAFEDHGTLARTIDTGVDDAADVMHRLAAAGVDMDDVGRTLEGDGVASFHESFAHVLAALDTKARQLAGR
jgi:transaldolase